MVRVWVRVRFWVRVMARAWAQTTFSVRVGLGVGFVRERRRECVCV
jgi:hypothetical protein